jgi:hypothetical protein
MDTSQRQRKHFTMVGFKIPDVIFTATAGGAILGT